jgi:hypothetical protein
MMSNIKKQRLLFLISECSILINMILFLLFASKSRDALLLALYLAKFYECPMLDLGPPRGRDASIEACWDIH